MESGFLYNNFDSCSPNNCKITLKNKELWEQFHNLETEMIITKSGRRMFPSLNVQITDLEPNAHYCVLLELSTVSKCRYKYSSSVGWAPAGTDEAQSPHRIYLHPESPATGEHWMTQPISFGRLKLTNTPLPPAGHMVLSSMHKYQPKIVIVKTGNPRAIGWAPSTSVTFPETEFIAVTAYQNEKITKLKIDNNPFAKGFRENGQSKSKRKRPETEEMEEEKIELIDVDDSSNIKSDLIPTTIEDDVSISSNSSYTESSSPEISITAPTTFSIPPTFGGLDNPFQPTAYNYTLFNPYSCYNPYCTPALYDWTYKPQYYSYSAAQVCGLPQDLTLKNDAKKPRKLTDFSIRAITGLS